MVRKLRIAAGLTQEDLAYKSGLTVGTIKNLEYGRRAAQRTTLRLVADVLGVSTDELAAANKAVA